MMSFGGFLLNDVFNCDGCIWFAVGTDHEASASASSSGWNSSGEEAIEGNVKVYTGTVRNALDLNSHQTPFSDFTEACGMWVFHPHKWDSQPGKQIEFDVGVGSQPLALEAGVAYTASGITVPVAPLSDPSVESSCKVSLGGDGQLRNYQQGNEVIAVGNCNKVSYVSDTTSGSNAFAYNGRKVFGIVGLFVFLLIRGIQYFVLFSGLATRGGVKPSEEEEKQRKKEAEEREQERTYRSESESSGLYEYCLTFWCICLAEQTRITNWYLLAYDFVFFSEFPGLLLLPLNALEFHGDCDQILTFRFSATLWMLGAGFAAFGAVFHLVDALIPVFCDVNSSVFTLEIWPRVMLIVGAILTLFVAALKVIYILQMGLTFAFGLKLEWAFSFQYWPIRQAVCLDMFQLSAFFFFVIDKFFNAYAGYLKYFASEETKQTQAGRFAQLFSKKVVTCETQVCNVCGKWWFHQYDHSQRLCECMDAQPTTCGGEFGILDGRLLCKKCRCDKSVHDQLTLGHEAV